ncbi:MAG TPA: FtsW/RodA/SpoVE family cell cycle protein [Candidatus Butyricicoccus stercorigallinarum]|nr:FtsW/RodA/SpoVE family cell cycle protein [Candidatus Butyricicoccus stercorigallinarum]
MANRTFKQVGKPSKKRKKRPAHSESLRTLGSQPIVLFVLFQLVSLLIVQASGRGTAYLYMMIPLLVITYGGWFLVNHIRAEVSFFINAAMLLTFGTMIQCMLLEEDGRPTSLLVIYVLSAIVGVLCGFGYRRLPGLSSARGVTILMGVAVFLYAATLIWGVAVGGGVRNWIRIFGMSIQPSEFTKGIYVLVMAGLLGTRETPGRKRVWTAIVFTLVNLGFLSIQGEFGTFLLVLCTFLIFIFLFVPDIRVFAAIFGLLVAGGAAITACCAALLKITGGTSNFGPLSFALTQIKKISNRFVYWLDPASDAQGAGYQIMQARKALLNSNLFGSETTTPLSNPTNDMVFPALTERCGLLIALTVCILFGLLLVRGTRIYFRCPDRYHQAVCAGLCFQFILQAFIIIGGSIGMFPLTGITLPLISRGGSSLMSTFIFLSIILVISAGNLWDGRRDYSHYETKLQKARAVYADRLSALRNRNRRRPGVDNTRKS